jgi:hypothetical protein
MLVVNKMGKFRCREKDSPICSTISLKTYKKDLGMKLTRQWEIFRFGASSKACSTTSSTGTTRIDCQRPTEALSQGLPQPNPSG